MITTQLKIGDEIGVWDGTHCTRMRVEKINRKTVDCVEMERSHYPGKRWRINLTYQYCVYSTYEDGRVKTTWQNT